MDFCTIASGSSGNCTYVGSDHTALLVDAGITGKRIADGLHAIDRDPSQIHAVLVTHEHSDHIRSLGILARKYHLPMYGTPGTMDYVMHCSQMGYIDPSLIHLIMPDEPFSIGDLEIEGFRIRHDAAQPCGYRISSGGHSMAIATDMGCYDEYTVEHLQGLDGIILEANHDVNMLQAGPYPYPLKRRILGQLGHLSNESAGALLCEILHDDMKQIVLGHLSKENNYEALAFAAVHTEITMGDNPYHGDDFNIEVARRDEPGQLHSV
ncbi:MAG: MBL fold metallo-hydrolase [Lachnospiraceae bacterium]|nr:MBL fold metallo-hydrolase [Lachnospiraceae bacterium]